MFEKKKVCLLILIGVVQLSFAQMIVRDGNNPSIEFMRVTELGNVGIGTLEPGATLQIHGTNDSLQINGFYGNSPTKVITRAGMAVSVPTTGIVQGLDYPVELHTGVYSRVVPPDLNSLYMSNAGITSHVYNNTSSHLAVRAQLGLYCRETDPDNPMVMHSNFYGARAVLDADDINDDINALTEGKAVGLMTRVFGNQVPYENIFALAVSGAKSLFLDKVGIADSWSWEPQFELDVDGDIRATGSVYYGTGAGTAYTKPDYVFSDGYNKLNLDEIETFIEKNHHLPWTTATEDEKENAVDMTRMAFETLEAVENMQLQILSLNKRIKELETQNRKLMQIINP